MFDQKFPLIEWIIYHHLVTQFLSRNFNFIALLQHLDDD